MRARALVLLATALGLAGCASPPALGDYTAAAYPVPHGFAFPQDAGEDAPAGMQGNPGPFDGRAANPIFPGSKVNATEGHAAVLRGVEDPRLVIVTLAVRLERPLDAGERDLYRSLCTAPGAAHLAHDDVLAIVTWTPGAEQAGRGLVDAIVAKTGAERMC